MKNITTLLIIFILFIPHLIYSQPLEQLVEPCATGAGEDATYLKDFMVNLNAAPADGRPPVARYSLVLSKNNIYRFSICKPEQSEGNPVLQLFDSNRLIFSSFNEETGEEYNPFNFMCRKTGIYHVFISFKDGKKGEAVGILSYVSK